jgi:predicted  nucleic acid-binding Zn-ribbon protein
MRSELETSQNAAKELEKSNQHEIESLRSELAQTSSEDLEQLTRELETAQNEIIEIKSRQDPLLSELETTRKNLSDATMEIARLQELQETRGAEATTQSAVDDQDTKKLLTVLDGLLEHLPPDLINKFANSDDYVLYEKVLDGYGV